jgi:hypothetical protein
MFHRQVPALGAAATAGTAATGMMKMQQTSAIRTEVACRTIVNSFR